DDDVTKKKTTRKRKPSIIDNNYDDNDKPTRKRNYAPKEVKVVEYNGKEVKMLLNNHCHQCKRNDKGEVVRCYNCGSRRFCRMCMETWYALSAFILLAKVVTSIS
nr:JmjC domain-containing protein [Tanacetum cinerariifolium]